MDLSNPFRVALVFSEQKTHYAWYVQTKFKFYYKK